MIPDPSTLGLFLAAAAVLLLVPGPAVLYIVARAVDQGRLAGLVSTLGIGAGTLVHVAAAAVGVSTVLVGSTTAFSLLKYAGAAYLIYLGVRRLAVGDPADAPGDSNPQRLSRVFYQGVLVNILNPKTALFFFAFLPQFVDVSRGSVGKQILFLGMLFVLLGIVSDSLYALLAGTAGGWLKGNARFLRARRYFTGAVFIGLGIAAALAGSEKK